MVSLQDLRPRGCGSALHHQNIFNANRNACQRREGVAFLGRVVNSRRLDQSTVAGQTQVNIQPRINLTNALVICVGQISSLGVAGEDLRTHGCKRPWLLNISSHGLVLACQTLSLFCYGFAFPGPRFAALYRSITLGTLKNT